MVFLIHTKLRCTVNHTSDRQEGYFWLGLFRFILTVTSIFILYCSESIYLCPSLIKLYQQYTPLYYRHTPPSTCSHECPLRSSRTQSVLASQPLLSSSIAAVCLMYAERGTEFTVPRETERKYGCNPS